MIILFTALTLAAAPVATVPAVAAQAAAPQQRVSTTLFAAPVQFRGCAPVVTKVGAVMHAGFHRLGDLPDAHEEIAVNRMVNGCPAPLIVRYNVSRR